MIEFLVSEKVDLIISVDGSDKSTFEMIRRGANFEYIMEQAEKAAHAYQDYPLTQSPSFYITIQKENQHQILEIVQLAHSLGIRRIGCGIVVLCDEFAPCQDEILCKELENTYQYIEDNNMFIDVYPTKIGNYVFVDGKYKNTSNYIVNTICNAPLVGATIDYTGDVYLCCNVGDCVGNISESSFLEIWKSERYNHLRKIVNDKDNMPEKCRKCTWFNRN